MNDENSYNQRVNEHCCRTWADYQQSDMRSDRLSQKTIQCHVISQTEQTVQTGVSQKGNTGCAEELQ